MSGAPIGNARLAAYGLLGMPLAMAALPIYVHVPKFYADTVGLSLASIGGFLLLTRALDAIQDPLLGWWSDRRRARPGGRWVFIGIGAPLLALGMVGLFNPPRGGGPLLAAWLVSSLLLVYGAYSLITVSYQAHGAEMSDDAVERTRITAWREGFALVGVVAAAALPELLSKAAGARAGFAAFSAIFAPLLLLAAAIAIVGAPRAGVRSASQPPALRTLAQPFSNARFRWLLPVFVLNGIAAAIPATLVLFYVEDVLRRADLAALFLIAYFAAGAAGLPLWVRLSRAVGKARAWLCGMALSIAAFLGAFFLGAGDTAAFFLVCGMSGLGLGADLALPPSLLADVIDDDAARGLGRREGAYFGLWNLATKLNLALAAGVALPLLQGFGYLTGQFNDSTALTALAAVYALLPCLLKAVAAAVLWASPLIPGDTR
jgi:Na+/melibiose symporter-like transporter